MLEPHASPNAAPVKYDYSTEQLKAATISGLDPSQTEVSSMKVPSLFINLIV